MRRIETVVANIITELYDNGDLNKAVLASLRSAPKLTDRKAQDVVPLMMRYLDEEQLSKTGIPTKAESAVYTAVRLYALHQQGNEDFVFAKSANRADESSQEPTGVTLFTALAKLTADPQNRSNIDRRVQQALAMSRLDALTNALTHLVGSLHRSTMQIDYARLGQNLYQFQFDYESANRVRLIWAQDYYYNVAQIQAAEGKENHDN